MVAPFVRSPYNYDMDMVSEETGVECLDESLADQSQAEDADVNVIARRFGLFGELPTAVGAPTYADYSEVTDYHTAMNAIARANEAFDQMPAEVRARFHNNPGEFVDFCSDDKNREEASKLGLLVPKAAELSRDAANMPDNAPAAVEPAAQ